MKVFDAVCIVCGELEVVANEQGNCPKVCPKCGNELKRKFVSAPIIYKTEGFTKKVSK